MSEVELSEALDMVRILRRQGNVRPAAAMMRLVDRVRQLQTNAVDRYGPSRFVEKGNGKVAFTEGSEGRE